MIDKLASDTNRFKRQTYAFRNARSAFKAYLESLHLQDDEYVLLPSFIGWSSREGSGVFDPVKELGIRHAFYKLNKDLCIDVEHLKATVGANKTALIVIIHYFGFVDPSYHQIIDLSKEWGIPVLEDEAHALYTDIVGGVSGRLGDAAIFSLHKMLPVPSGGVLCINSTPPRKDYATIGNAVNVPLHEYDLKAIADTRLTNMETLRALLVPHQETIKPLRPFVGPGEIPQTFPVLIGDVSRDRLYELMNEAGFGVVSLYHTLIKEITLDLFPESFFVSERILNLPVHQDAKFSMMKPMVETLVNLISKLKDELR